MSELPRRPGAALPCTRCKWMQCDNRRPVPGSFLCLPPPQGRGVLFTPHFQQLTPDKGRQGARRSSAAQSGCVSLQAATFPEGTHDERKPSFLWLSCTYATHTTQYFSTESAAKEKQAPPFPLLPPPIHPGTKSGGALKWGSVFLMDAGFGPRILFSHFLVWKLILTILYKGK